VVLPLMGSTLARTGALYAVGGPGAFVAQQSASREILRQADYGAIAERYDPLDPLGLAVSSLVPLPFAAAGAVRNVRAARAARAADDVPPAAVADEAAVDAAMVQNLTVARDRYESLPVPESVPRAADDAAPAVRAADEVGAPVTPARAADVEPAPAAPRDIMSQARAALDEWQASGRTMDEFAAGRALSPEMTGLMTRLQEAASDPQKLAQLMGEMQQPAQVARAADAGNAEISSIAQRLAMDEARVASMPVRVEEETGRVITVADEIAEARRVADEGTPEALGARDADLIRVAAECAVTFAT
jgi:hypothetical protein